MLTISELRLHQIRVPSRSSRDSPEKKIQGGDLPSASSPLAQDFSFEMLTIKRVPTVVSNYQEEDASIPAGCGETCVGPCCLPQSKVPLYAYKRDSSIPNTDPSSGSFFLNDLLLCQWEDRMRRGLFRYDVMACESKVIPGKNGFIAQLNEGRHLKKRPTEFRIDRVLQPFDPNKFNFRKIGQEEVLFNFATVDGTTPENIVAINVSPIEYGHVLLIPQVLDCLPQRIDGENFLLALGMAAEAGSPYFRLGYNSLGAFATVNHLHFQAYYLALPFPVEKAATRRICLNGTESGVKVSELSDYPVRGLVFEGGNNLMGLSDVVAKSCICLQESNIPFNVLISDSGRRIFLFPQCYAEKQALGEVDQELLDTLVNPAVWEISGHIVLKRKKDYEEASDACAWRILAEVSLSDERFQEVKAYIFDAAGLVEFKDLVEQDDSNENKDISQAPPSVSTHLPQGSKIAC